MNSPYTYRRTMESGTVRVEYHGQPIGLLSRTREGYVLRDLAGEIVDETFGVSRPVAASALRRAIQALEAP